MSDPYPTSQGATATAPAPTTGADGDYYLPEGLPMPVAAGDGLGAEFYEACRRHELVVQRCTRCQGWQWGPEYICYQCHSFDLGYERVSGKGKIFSWERPWYPVHPALQKKLPYVVVLVELPDAGNVRMVGNLLGDPMQDVVIGAEVEAVFEDHRGEQADYTLVQWRVV